MAKEGKEEKYPVIDTLHGVDIRKFNTVCIRLEETAYRDLVEQSHKTTISLTKIIILRSEPCQQCGCDNVTLVLKKKKQSYRIGENGGTFVKNNGKGQEDINEGHPAQ